MLHGIAYVTWILPETKARPNAIESSCRTSVLFGCDGDARLAEARVPIVDLTFLGTEDAVLILPPPDNALAAIRAFLKHDQSSQSYVLIDEITVCFKKSLLGLSFYHSTSLLFTKLYKIG